MVRRLELSGDMMRTSLLLVLAGSLSLTACVQQQQAPDAIAKAIPTADQVSIKLPQQAAKALPAVGQLATWYVATRDVTRTFNGGSAWVLVLIHSIVAFPVTSVSGDTYTWGPWSNALDPAEYRLDVTANADGTYDYALSGRSKTQAGASFEVVIDGHANVDGTGSFQVDFDASKRVNPIDSGDAKGQMTASYDLPNKHLGLQIATTNAAGQAIAADYAYDEAADGGGAMLFDFQNDAGGTAALENATLRSRWLANGSGRTDARITGGDLGADFVTASECWSTMFLRTYYTDSASFAPTEGDPGACAFANPDLPPAP